jgi:anionic cell wall polymer biosynthesis LytR-Cps2A-Psr (LCP) family protein
MNGERALEYARSRQTTSDFDRSQRQRAMLLSIRRQLEGLASLPRLARLVPALRDNVRTNLRPIELRELARLLATIPQRSFEQIGLDGANLFIRRNLPDGTYVLSPRDGNFTALRRFLDSALGSAPASAS